MIIKIKLSYNDYNYEIIDLNQSTEKEEISLNLKQPTN